MLYFKFLILCLALLAGKINGATLAPNSSLINSGSCSLTLSNYTWTFDSSRDQSVEGVSKENCAKECLSKSWCRGYTWSKDDSSGSICHMFKKLTNQHACDVCSECVSGTATPISGVCSESWISAQKTDSELACVQLCSKTSGCQYYSYSSGNNLFKTTCFLFNQCTPSTTCEPFESGKLECFKKKSECSNYKVMSSATRLRTNGEGHETDYDHPAGHWRKGEWQGTGWYRITGGAGSKLTDRDPGEKHCGTDASGYIVGDHPVGVTGVTFDRIVHYSYGSNPKYYQSNIRITNCGSYYVYYLPSNHGRYCTE